MKKKLGLRDFRVGNIVLIYGEKGEVKATSNSCVVIQANETTYYMNTTNRESVKDIVITNSVLDNNFTRIIDSANTGIPVWELDKHRDISTFKENEFFLQANDDEPVKMESIRELQNHLWMLGLDDSIII